MLLAVFLVFVVNEWLKENKPPFISVLTYESTAFHPLHLPAPSGQFAFDKAYLVVGHTVEVQGASHTAEVEGGAVALCFDDNLVFYL
jgi:hypothetical protein